MSNAEQIADAILDRPEDLKGWLVELIKTAQDLQRQTQALEFRPADEFDYYRSQWEDAQNAASGYGYKLKIASTISANDTKWLDVSEDQAERILKMLSEEEREGQK